MTHRTLVVTNDFPPRQGGIQSFVHQLALGLPAGEVVVYASDHRDAADFDVRQPFPVLRHPTPLLVPTPAAAHRTAAALREYDCRAVLFGAAAPNALLAPILRRAGAERVVALTHGHEAAWAGLPVARQLLHRIGRDCDVLTYLGDYTRSRIARATGPGVELQRLAPGVDIETFHGRIDSTSIKAKYGLSDRPVIVCVSRLVRRKGQDTLLDAMPMVRAAVPGATLLLVGNGRYRRDLERRARDRGVASSVVFAGGVAHERLAEHYAAGDVFAMPCRTRRGGLDVEGLGMVYLEASAMGLPVVAGNSGGAPDAVRDGETGFVADGRDVHDVAGRLIELLRDDALRARMGAAGRAWVERDWQWPAIAARLQELLRGRASTG